jgi:hypothetical protein
MTDVFLGRAPPALAAYEQAVVPAPIGRRFASHIWAWDELAHARRAAPCTGRVAGVAVLAMRAHVRSRRDSIGIGITGALLILYIVAVSDDPVSPKANRIALILVSVFTLALGAFALYRSFRLGVTIGPDEVVVHNLLRTRRVPRRDVARFSLGRLRWQDRDAVVLETTGGGSIVVSSLSASPYEMLRGSMRVSRFVDELNALLR